MAKDTNKVFFTGTVFNPEFKEFESGATKLSFTLAVDDSYKKKGSTEYTNKTIWKNVQVWGYLAQKWQGIVKFDLLAIEGKADQDEYEKDGVKKRYDFVTPFSIKALEEVKKAEKLTVDVIDGVIMDADGVPF